MAISDELQKSMKAGLLGQSQTSTQDAQSSTVNPQQKSKLLSTLSDMLLGKVQEDKKNSSYSSKAAGSSSTPTH